MSDNDNAYSGKITPGVPSSEVDAAFLDGASLSTDGSLSLNSDERIPTEKAVKTYTDGLTDDLSDRIDEYEDNVQVDASGNVDIVNDLSVSGDLDVTDSAAITGDLSSETLTLNKADGVTPMTVTSTTKVANLNADQVDGCDVEDSDSLGTSDVKIPTQGNVKSYADSVALAIGDVVFKAAERTGAPALASNMQWCDGALIDDVDSPFDGQRTYNMNGGDVVLTLTWTADAGGAYATVSADDLHALNIDDEVTGSGIAAGTFITDITGTTVTIGDVSASGSIETTFTNDGLAAIGGAGGSQGSAMQRITGEAGGSQWRYYQITSSGAMSVVEYLFSGSRVSDQPGSKILFDNSDSTSPNTAKTDDKRTKAHGRILKAAMRIK